MAGQAYLVPFGDKATLIIGYRGLKDLIYRSGMIQMVDAQVVRENDHEKIVADGTLHTERHGWSTHVAEIRMVIAPDLLGLTPGRVPRWSPE